MKTLQRLEPIGEKYGEKIYSANPSIPETGAISKTKRNFTGDERRGLIVDQGTGEIIGGGGAILYEQEEVDKERFVKLYLDGVQGIAGLTQTGLKVFGVVYILRRYGLALVTVTTDDQTIERIAADLAADDDAQALMLDLGAFVGLQVNAWRHRHQIDHGGLPPMPRWHALNCLALYGRTRAVKAKRRDDAQRIEDARVMISEKYALHREVAARDHFGRTVH